jgi:phosphohistidine phosphatase
MLMRHGKSSWDRPELADHERPLTPRGERAAARIGRFVAGAGFGPQLVITSTAVRARRTAALAAEAGGWQSDIVREPDLYSGGPEEVLDVVRAVDRPVERVLVVGHNPTWADLAGRLVGGASLRFPTAAVACIRFPEDRWDTVGSRAGELLWFVVPRLL